MVFSALALFLMVADTRFQHRQPLARRGRHRALPDPMGGACGRCRPCATAPSTSNRLHERAGDRGRRARQAGVAVAARQPGRAAGAGERAAAQAAAICASRLSTPGVAAEVLYDAADPYTRKVIIDKGLAQGIEAGSPVIDESGVLGQVTRVHPLISEVTLVTDRDQAIPVLNARTGARSVAYRRRRRRTAARSNCASWPPMPTCRKATCSPPAAWTASTRRACRSPRSRRSSAAPIPPSPASPASPQALVDGARHVMVLAPMLGPAAAAPRAPKMRPRRRSRPAQARGARHDHASRASSCCCRPTRSSSGAACCWRCWSTCCRWAARLDARLAGPGAGVLERAPAAAREHRRGLLLRHRAWTCTRPRCWASTRWPTPP